MLLVLVLILSISFVSRSRQEHGDNAHYLNIKNSQVQRPEVRGRHHDDNSIALEGPRARKDSLKHTIDSKPLPHHFRHLHKRAVSPQVWSEYICKGEKLLALMAMSTEQATASLGFASESTFTNYADLDTNGWSLYDRSANFDLRNLNIGNVFNDLQLDGMSGGPLDLRFKNRVAAWSQDEKYTVYGVEQNVSLSILSCHLRSPRGIIYSSHHVVARLIWKNTDGYYSSHQTHNTSIPSILHKAL